MIKKAFLLITLCMGCFITAYAQQTMTDSQILQYAIQQRQAGKSETDIATELLKRGATMTQIQQMRQRYSRQLERANIDGAVDRAIDNAENRMRVNNAPLKELRDKLPDLDFIEEDSLYLYPIEEKGKKVFGRDIFNNRLLTFEPQMNIATPQNYVLGPGDQLIIDVYGATQETQALTVSPDGNVTIPNVGPLPVSGLTVYAAQSRIAEKMGRYYSESEIKVTVGQTRTIVVNVLGEVNTPGTYTLSAFATVFHALYMAGGISDLGTLRDIKVYRQGKQISSVDVYEFILNGRLAGNVTLMDNDVIQVGAYESIVDIAGKVRRPMAYEMRSTESINNLLKYSGGFTGDAYKKLLRVIRKSEDLRTVYNVEENDFANFMLTDGDSISVDSIIDRYKNMVEVRGAIYRPGMYHLGGKVTTVRSLIEIASGLKEEALTSRAVLRRMKANRTQEVTSVDVEGIMNGTAADITLRNEDVLFIPTIAELQNLRTLTIDGEVVFPGTFEYAEGMTIEDLVLQAGGLTDAASAVKVDVARRLRDPNARDATMELAQTFSFALKDNYEVDGDRSFTLQPYDVVHVRTSPVFQSQINVTVEGEVAFKGTYTMEEKNQRLSDLIKAAGGVIPGSYVRGARLERRLSEDERARLKNVLQIAEQSATGKDSIDVDQVTVGDTYSVGIRLDEALAHPGSTQDIELMDGDRLIVPRFNHTVRISGNVSSPNTVAYEEGKSYKYYIKQAGGFGNRAKKNHAYVVYQNGTMGLAKNSKIEPGCEIVVPTKAPRDENALSRWLAIGTGVTSIVTMFATISHLIK